MDITTTKPVTETPITDEALTAATQNQRMMLVNALNAYAIQLRDEMCARNGLTVAQRCELYDMSIEAEAFAARLQGAQ